MAAISAESLEHVDEALTSLQAILRYDHQLNRTDVRVLVSDAIQRLRLYVNELSCPNLREARCITFPRSVSCPLRAEGKLLHPGVTDGVRASTNFTGDRVYHEVIARTYGAVRDSAWLG